MTQIRGLAGRMGAGSHRGGAKHPCRDSAYPGRPLAL